MKRQMCHVESSSQTICRLRRSESTNLKMSDKKRSFCIVPLLAFLVTWMYLIGMVYSDEIKTIDGTIFEGEMLKVTEEFLSLRKTDGSVSDILLNDVNLISREKEIIIVNREGKKFSVLRIPKPENFSIKEAVFTTTDTLTSLDMGMETTKVAAKEAAEAQSVSEEEVQPATVITLEAKSSTDQPQATSAENIVQAEGEIVIAPLKTWKGNIDAGISMKDGNTESTTIYIKGSYANERTLDNIYFDMLVLYETVTSKDSDVDEETVNEQRATGKYEYKHTPRFYSFFNQYFEHDEIESLNYRSISSPGVGYRFIDKEWLRYRAEAGPAYTYERFHGGITENYFGIRIGQYLDWIIWHDTKFYAKSEYIQSVEDRDDWRVDSGLGIRHNITKSVALSVEFLDQYNNTPAEGKEKEDRTFIGSMGYNF
jgi:putative salt-induced outer membrane protein YdiY